MTVSTLRALSLRSPHGVLMRTKSGRSNAARRNAFFVSVSRLQFRIWWLIFMALHAACLGYFGVAAYCYWKLPLTFMALNLETYRMSMPLRDMPIVAVCHSSIAAGHAFFLMRMLLSSLLHRRFTFGRLGWRIKTTSKCHQDARGGGVYQCAWLRSVVLAFTRLNVLWIRVFSRRGMLGIEGKHFALLFILRELFESVLQSVQAYRMSLYVPRVLLNRFYVGIIVINCWSSPMVQYMYAADPPLVRLLCLVLDIGLDFTATVGIPVALVLPYRNGYDPVNATFDFLLWYDDFWLINMMNEFKLLFVSSWGDLVSRMFFSVSLLIAVQNAKSLLRKTNRKVHTAATGSNQFSVSAGRDASSSFSARWKTQVMPFISRKFSQTMLPKAQHMSATMSTSSIPVIALPPPVLDHTVTKVAHVLFAVWGIVVLALHLHGELQTMPAECALTVRPWFSYKSACSLVQINCNARREQQQLTCTRDEMDAILENIDETTLAHIVIRHCPHVEISPRLKSFSRLVGFKIYNSTLVDWSASAALTQASHPHVVFLFLVFVNMSSFPDGLLSDDFPKQLLDIEFSGSNLTTLPASIRTKWPPGGSFVLEQGILAQVPPVMERMGISFLSLVRNQISELPDFIFTSTNAITIWLSGNPIKSLPESLQPSRSIRRVHLIDTKVETLPVWMNAEFFELAVVHAGGTPLCSDVLASLSGATNSSRSPSLSVAKSAYLQGALTCDEREGDDLTYYPSLAEASLDESKALTAFFK
uniref:Uncharacterized protein n=1 Tax=Globisporangium ultimum (strain ATCC 200006 / CBS 805.95 / DAOM BR144) TaxID=431595 RepID=K3WNS9_GLOUD